MPTPTIRTWQIEQLRKMPSILRHIVATTSQHDATAYRDGGTGWTVLEVLGHLRDFENIFLQRARLTVEQDNAALPFPDPDATVAAGNYNAREINDVYQQWATARAALVDYLSARADSDWTRTAKHPTRGDFSLDNQLLLIVWHDTNHLEQIAHILDERQPAR